MLRALLLCGFCLSSSLLADKPAQPTSNVISAGPWVTVSDSGWNNRNNNVSPQPNESGLDANNALRFGLGAIIIMLIVSTALSIGLKLYPNIMEIVASSAEGRSLDEMSSLAQYAFEAFEKYQSLNDFTE